MQMVDYQLHKSKTILKNQKEIIMDLDIAYQFLRKNFTDTTWEYKKYNIFAVTSPSIHFYNLFYELKDIVRGYVNHDQPLWIQSWLNYHQPNQVLDWHDHYWPIHGYISIDPKGTETEFETYTITNEVGNIYIGPGYRPHRVNVTEMFTAPRITLGFDIHNTPNVPYEQFSLIPI